MLFALGTRRASAHGSTACRRGDTNHNYTRPLGDLPYRSGVIAKIGSDPRRPRCPCRKGRGALGSTARVALCSALSLFDVSRRFAANVNFCGLSRTAVHSRGPCFQEVPTHPARAHSGRAATSIESSYTTSLGTSTSHPVAGATPSRAATSRLTNYPLISIQRRAVSLASAGRRCF